MLRPGFARPPHLGPPGHGLEANIHGKTQGFGLILALPPGADFRSKRPRNHCSNILIYIYIVYTCIIEYRYILSWAGGSETATIRICIFPILFYAGKKKPWKVVQKCICRKGLVFEHPSIEFEKALCGMQTKHPLCRKGPPAESMWDFYEKCAFKDQDFCRRPTLFYAETRPRWSAYG